MPAPACPDSTTRPVPRDVQDVVTALMRERQVPGLALAVTTRERLLYAGGFGLATIAPQQPARCDTAWLWFSMSKLVTATAAVHLAEHGGLDLDAPFRTYLTDGRSVRSAATVRQLLSHTAGIADPPPIRWVRPAGSPARDAELFDRQRTRIVAPRRAPGGPARYTNLGYLALGQVLERAAGLPFRELVEQRVLQPAGMTATGYEYRPGAPAATGYVRVPRPADPVLRAVLPRGVVGARHGRQLALRPFLVDGAAYGGLVGTVTDAARFARLHLRDGELNGTRVISAEAAREMRQLRWPGKPFDHGLGWFRRPVEAARPAYVEHFGAGAGFWNAMRLYPEDGLAAVVMANTTQPYDIDAVFETVRRVGS